MRGSCVTPVATEPADVPCWGATGQALWAEGQWVRRQSRETGGWGQGGPWRQHVALGLGFRGVWEAKRAEGTHGGSTCPTFPRARADKTPTQVLSQSVQAALTGTPRTGSLSTTDTYSSQFWSWDSVSGEGPLCGSQTPSVPCVITWQKGQRALWGPFHKGTNPVPQGPTLVP